MGFTLPQPVAGRKLAGRVTLRSSVSQRVVVKFARQGQGAFVEDAREVALQAGEPSSINLSLDGRDDYQQVRLFVAPLRATPATLQVSGDDRKSGVEGKSVACRVAVGG